jgi:cytochrome P450
MRRGGQETMASVLSWFVKFMPKDPEIQRRLHDEVCSVFGDDNDNGPPMNPNVVGDAEKLPILEAVATETLRCARVAHAISRTCE